MGVRYLHAVYSVRKKKIKPKFEKYFETLGNFRDSSSMLLSKKNLRPDTSFREEASL